LFKEEKRRGRTFNKTKGLRPHLETLRNVKKHAVRGKVKKRKSTWLRPNIETVPQEGRPPRRVSHPEKREVFYNLHEEKSGGNPYLYPS